MILSSGIDRSACVRSKPCVYSTYTCCLLHPQELALHSRFASALSLHVILSVVLLLVINTIECNIVLLLVINTIYTSLTFVYVFRSLFLRWERCIDLTPTCRASTVPCVCASCYWDPISLSMILGIVANNV